MLWAALAARAHDSVGSIAVRPLFDDQGLAGAWTTWGLVLREGAGWWRVCEEANAGTRDAWLDAAGRVWLARPDGLRETTDAGCSVGQAWIDAPIAMFAPLGDDVLLVADGVPGDAVYRLDAAGPVALALLPEPTDVRSVALAGDGGWWLAGLSGGAPALWRSVDRGGSWVAIEAPPDLLAVAVHGPASDGVGVWVSGLTGAGTSPLWSADGASMVAQGELPLAVGALGCVGGRCFATLAATSLVRWDPVAGVPSTLEVVDGGPTRCLWVEGGVLWGCTDVSVDPTLSWTADGETWTDEMLRWAVLDRACDPGTAGEQICVLPGTDTGAPDTAAPPTDGGLEVRKRCGCASAGGAGPGWLAAGALLARRRRRYSNFQAR